MDAELQSYMREALINNSYSYQSTKKALDREWRTSYDYLDRVQKTQVGYEEFHFYSGNDERYNRDTTKIGHLYLDKEKYVSFPELGVNVAYAHFDLNYDFIDVNNREIYRRATQYYIDNDRSVTANSLGHIVDPKKDIKHTVKDFEIDSRILINPVRQIYDLETTENGLEDTGGAKRRVYGYSPDRNLYYKHFTIEQMVENPDIFTKIPIVIIDNQVIWDWKLLLTKDCARFTLPFGRDFVVKRERDEMGELIYQEHHINVLIVDNMYYTRLGDTNASAPVNQYNTLHFSTNNYNIYVDVDYLENHPDNKMTVPTSSRIDYINSRRSTSSTGRSVEGTITKRQKILVPTEEEGTMFISFHVKNQAGVGSPLGSQLIPMWQEVDSNGKRRLCAKLTAKQYFKLAQTTTGLKVSFIFIEDLHWKAFLDRENFSVKERESLASEFASPVQNETFIDEHGNRVSHAVVTSQGTLGVPLVVLEQDNLVPYNMPIPIENLMLFKRKDEEQEFSLCNKFLNGSSEYPMIERHYPNIYRVTDDEMKVNDAYRLFYFYESEYKYEEYSLEDLYQAGYPITDSFKEEYLSKSREEKNAMVAEYLPKLRQIRRRHADNAYTVIHDFYFKFLLDHFSYSTTSYEAILNKIYYNVIGYDPDWDNAKIEEFKQVFKDIYDYKAMVHNYGDNDFLYRYSKEETEGEDDTIRRTPSIFKYHTETMKQWIKDDPWLLNKYVLEQKKIGFSYHLYTNTIDLESRIRYSTVNELGDEQICYEMSDGTFFVITKYPVYDSSSNRIQNGRVKHYDADGHDITGLYYADAELIEKLTMRDNVTGDVINQNEIDQLLPMPTPEELEQNTTTYTKTTKIVAFDAETFTEPMYVFAFNDAQQLKSELSAKIFVDGILIGDCAQYRKVFMDYFYIPVSKVTDDSFIEIEIYPTFYFREAKEFHSTTSYDSLYIATITKLVAKDGTYFVPLDNGHYIHYTKDGNIIPQDPVSYYNADGTQITSGNIPTIKELKALTAQKVLQPFSKDGMLAYGVPGSDALSYTSYYIGSKEISDEKQIKAITELWRVGEFTEEINKDAEGDALVFDPNDHIYPTLQDLYFQREDTQYHERYGSDFFDIKVVTNEGTFELDEDTVGKPIEFTEMKSIIVRPKDETLLNKSFNAYMVKTPRRFPVNIMYEGFPYIEIVERAFPFFREYIRVYKNGKLLPDNHWEFYNSFYCPRILVKEWCKNSDIIYIETLPYKSKLVYELDTLPAGNFTANNAGELTLDLKGIITKPFDIRYYDVFLNGRKLSSNNVFTIEPWSITFRNLVSNNHLAIYEKERDWEYYGLDYTTHPYDYTLDDLLQSSFITNEEKRNIIDDLIQVRKDPKLTIKNNVVTEDPQNIEDFTKQARVFSFYYHELISKNYMDPDVKQTLTTILEEQYPEIYETYYKRPQDDVRDDSERNRKANYPGVVLLDPDIIARGASSESEENRNLVVFVVGHRILPRVMDPVDITYYSAEIREALYRIIEHSFAYAQGNSDVIYTNGAYQYGKYGPEPRMSIPSPTDGSVPIDSSTN